MRRFETRVGRTNSQQFAFPELALRPTSPPRMRGGEVHAGSNRVDQSSGVARMWGSVVEGDVPSLAWAMATRAARITALDIILAINGITWSEGAEIIVSEVRMKCNVLILTRGDEKFGLHMGYPEWGFVGPMGSVLQWSIGPLAPHAQTVMAVSAPPGNMLHSEKPLAVRILTRWRFRCPDLP
jgi:hypothetical protein